VNKGCFRAYVINDKGVEQVVQFAIENWWITEYMSLNSGRPSEFYIQAVEDSELVAIDKKYQEELFGRLPQLERYFRIVLEKAYTASLMRIHYIFSFSGEELYNHFNTNFPGFVQRVPQYMLASYLGFTPEFLSKLRAKK
jgi:CRP-like cAMP-binding protein